MIDMNSHNSNPTHANHEQWAEVVNHTCGIESHIVDEYL